MGITNNRLFIFFIVLFSFLWITTKDGIEPSLLIKRKSNQISIYFDNKLIGTAYEKKITANKIFITSSDSDLNQTAFFEKNEPKKPLFDFKNQDVVELTVKNPYSIVVGFFKEQQPLFTYYFNPYRHLNSGWTDNNRLLAETIGYPIQIGLLNGIKWITFVILKPFVLVALIILIFIYFSQKNKPTPIIQTQAKLRFLGIVLLIAICLGSFFWSKYLMKNFSQNVPHVPDSISYILLGKIISSGKLIIPLSELPTFIDSNSYTDYFFHYFLFNERGMYIPYHLGHPLILAIGNSLGLLLSTPPFIGSLCLFFIFLITYQLTHSYFFSLFSILLTFVSPFFQTQTIDFMSHNSAALIILIILFALTLKNTKIAYTLTGFFLGWLLNTRPLTFIAVSLAILTFELLNIRKNNFLEQIVKKAFYSILGFLPLFILFLYYNYLTTGNVLISPYITHGILSKIGFGNEFKIGLGLLHGFSNIAIFSLFFLGNYYLSFFPFILSFFILPFSGTKKNFLFFLQILVFLIIGIWMLYDGNFFMYGPRFIYEAVPVLTIIYGLTFFICLSLFSNRYYKLIFVCIILIYSVGVLNFELAWLGIKKPTYGNIWFVPNNIQSLTGFNFVDSRFQKTYDQNKNKKVIILMKNCQNWWCTGMGFWYNNFPLNKSLPLFLSLPKNKVKINTKDSFQIKTLDWYSKN